MKQSQERVNTGIASDPTEQGEGIYRKIPKGLKLLVAGVALFGVTLAGCGEKTDALPAQTTIEAPTPTTPEIVTTTTEKAEVITAEDIEIDASLLEQSPEVLVQKLFESNTEWLNAGATAEDLETALASGDINNSSIEIAAKYDQIFIKALFPPDWESDPVLKSVVERMINIHQTTLLLFFATSFPDANPQDEKPYRREENLLKVESVKRNGNKVVVTYTGYATDTAAYNRVGKSDVLTGGTKVDSSIITRVTDTYEVTINGRLVLVGSESERVSQ